MQLPYPAPALLDAPLARTGSGCRRRTALIGGAAAIWGAATGCTSREPVRIGFLGGLTGRASDLGIGARNGARIAVEDVNAAGGVNGRLLELIVRDDELNDDTARLRLTELFDAGVSFVIGPVTSSVAKAVLPLANQRGVPLVSPLAGATSLSGLDDALFRVVSDTSSSARQQAAALVKRGLRRLVSVADMKNPVFSASWAEAAGQQFALGGGEVQKIEFEAVPGLKFSELAQRIALAKPDAVVIVATAADSALLVQQLRRLDAQPVIALSAWAGTEELPQLAGRSLDGVLVTQFYDRFSAAPGYLRFAAQFKQRFGDAPGYPSVNGHDAVQMGLAAYRAGGGAAPAAMLAALRQVRAMDGLQRKLTFNEFGDCLVPSYLIELRDGRYAPLA